MIYIMRNLNPTYIYIYQIIQTEDTGNGEGGSGKIRLTTLSITKWHIYI